MKQFFPLSILLALTLASPAQASTWIADYNLSIEKDPNYALSYYDRGLIYENQKRLAEAEADFRMTLKLNPGYDRAIKELQNMGLAP